PTMPSIRGPAAPPPASPAASRAMPSAWPSTTDNVAGSQGWTTKSRQHARTSPANAGTDRCPGRSTATHSSPGLANAGRQAGLRGQLLGESIVHAAQVQQRDPGRRPGRQVGQVAGIVEDPGLPVGGAQRALECRVVTTGTGPEM